MKSLQKKKRYTEDLEHRAVALATRNQELRDRIRVLLGRLQQMGIVAVPGVGVFSPSALQTPYPSVQPTATPAPPPSASAPIVPPDWPVHLDNQPSVSAQSLQLPESLPTAAPVATAATAPNPTPIPATLPQHNNASAAMLNQSLPLLETPPQSPSLALQPDPFSLSDSEHKLGVFDIPHMTCQ
ncbi:hypothetical protein BWQ96_09777 [Gracilariopsis chorda]|uniref:BZIP domain-containing protein n=1 Tax=Gracilariopsis chorda TaxID=448386 RepID=A0A2V3IEI0_9FLOR|nr:hypothetical protein BWQ96_09777 [Gracilariopsis chorda]|eukprot:PXF40496.1 hypothetical protein BWQ96_09777 [Gracilariopsis chorda]